MCKVCTCERMKCISKSGPVCGSSVPHSSLSTGLIYTLVKYISQRLLVKLHRSAQNDATDIQACIICLQEHL